MTTETRKLKINGSNMQINTLNALHTLWQISLPGRHRMTNFINMIEGLDSNRRDFDFVGNSHIQYLRDALPKRQFQSYFHN